MRETYCLSNSVFKIKNRPMQVILRAPMPGKILEVMVQAGDTVAAGEPLMILEAMKMENELIAPSGGKISSLLVKTGDKVEKNQNLIVISPSG
jgi:biotin carboxyl carrier protein